MKYAIARLCDKSGKTHLGTAFAVSSSHALTAFHCVGNYKTGKVNHQQTLLKFPVDQSVFAEYLTGDKDNDYAILLLQSPLPASFTPVPLHTRVFPHEPFRSPGYPSSLDGPDITSIHGNVTSDADLSSIFGGIPTIQLFCPEGAFALSLKEMSGAPVLVKNPEAAVGLIRWNPPQTNAPEYGKAGLVFSCPVRTIIENHPEFEKSVVPVSCDARISQLFPLAEALNDTEREQLIQSLKDLHREKLAKTEIRLHQPEWIIIPSFHFDIPIGNKPKDDQKEIIKYFIGMIARGLEELVEKTAKEVQLVVLLNLNLEDGLWKINLVCPSQEIIAYLIDHTPPRATAEQMKENLEKLNSDIYHQYGIVEGALTPIVFQYKPMLRHILATKKNQRNYPNQFLNPHLCKTTSHFLNFIGTSSMQFTPEGRGVVLIEENLGDRQIKVPGR